MHTVSANNIAQIPSFDRAELQNSDTLLDNDNLSQDTTTSVEFSNQDIESYVLNSEFEIDTNKLEKFWQNKKNLIILF